MGNNNSQLISSRFLAGCPPIPPLPKEAEVLQSFQQLLREKNVATVVIEEMEAMESMETKWMYVVINRQLVSSSATTIPGGTSGAALGVANGASGGEREFLDPKQCVQQILVLQYRTQDSKDLFRALRIHMVLKSKDWVDRFLAAEGMEALLLLLSTSAGMSPTFASTGATDASLTPDQKEKLELQLVLFQMEILNVLFLLTNFNQGIQAMVHAPSCFSSLLVLFECCRVNLVKSRILKLLGIVCCQSQTSQRAVLASFTARHASSAMDNGESSGGRFTPLLSVLLQNPNDLSFVVTCLTFVNILLNTTLQSEERKGIRDELESFGLLRFLAEVKQAQASKESAAASVAVTSASMGPTLATAFETQLQIFYKHFGHDVISRLQVVKKPVALAPPASLPPPPSPSTTSFRNLFSPTINSALNSTTASSTSAASSIDIVKPQKEQFLAEFNCELTALDEFQRQRVQRLFQKFIGGLNTTELQPQQLYDELFASKTSTLSSRSPILSTLMKAVSATLPSSSRTPSPTPAPASPDPVPTPEPTTTVSSASTKAGSASSNDDAARFRKLLSLGAPLEAVKAKMRQAGLDPELLNQSNQVPSPSSILSSDTASNFTPSAAVSSGSSLSAVAPKVKAREHPEYAKFFKLLSMGAPHEAVRAKMKHAGLQSELLESPDSEIDLPSSEPSSDNCAQENTNNRDNCTVSPPPAPVSLTTSAPVDPKVALAGLFARKTNQIHPTASPIAVKDHPEYTGFFKLITMGAPIDMVRAKMRIAGLRPELLETPEALLPASSTSKTMTDTKPNRPTLSLPLPPPIRPPRPTTKSFYWQQMRREEITGTIWQELEQHQATSSNNLLPVVLSSSDLASLEQEFSAQNGGAPDSAHHGSANGRGHQRTSSFDSFSPACPSTPRVVFLIDRSRSNNISIIVKQFKMSPVAIREAILRLDPNVLTIERVQALLKILPTEEEVALISGFQGDPSALNEAEKILKELMAVPRIKPRLVSFQAKLHFPLLLREIQGKFTKIQRACQEINDSSELKTLLLVVLQVGNKLNEGTQRGNAKGFHLSDLLKLSQLKSGHQKNFTLLHFIARVVREKKGNLVQLGHTLTAVNEVQSVAIGPELQSEMDKIEELCAQIQTEVNAISLKNSLEVTNDPFEQVMHQFLSESGQAIAVLRHEMNKTIESIRTTMARFEKTEATEPSSGSTTSTNSNLSLWTQAPLLFQTIYEFSVALMKADRENELIRMRLERQQKRQQHAGNGNGTLKPTCSSLQMRDKEPEAPEHSLSRSRDEEDDEEGEAEQDQDVVENIWQVPRSNPSTQPKRSRTFSAKNPPVTTPSTSTSVVRSSFVPIKPNADELASSSSCSSAVLFSPVDTRSVHHLARSLGLEPNKERTTSSSSSPEQEDNNNNNNNTIV